LTTLTGRRTFARDGYLPEREILTAIGPVLPCENSDAAAESDLPRLGTPVPMTKETRSNLEMLVARYPH